MGRIARDGKALYGFSRCPPTARALPTPGAKPQNLQSDSPEQRCQVAAPPKMTTAAHASLVRAMDKPSEALSPMCLFLQSMNEGGTSSSSAQLAPSGSSPMDNVPDQYSATNVEPSSSGPTPDRRTAFIHPSAPMELQPGFVPPAQPGKPPAPAFDGPPAAPHATTSAPPSAAPFAYPPDLYGPYGMNPANNAWNVQGYQAHHHPPTGHPLQQSHSPLLQPTGHAFPAQYRVAMHLTGNAFQPLLNPPLPPNAHFHPAQLGGQQHGGNAHMLNRVPNRYFQPQPMNQMVRPQVTQQPLPGPHPETVNWQWRQRRQKRSSSGSTQSTRQSVKMQIKRTELAKVRQQEALLEAQLRRMREDSQEKPSHSVGLTAAEVEASNSFKEFLKAEYEEGGYTNSAFHWFSPLPER